ncbi:MAG: hypothetical protein V4519_05080 [Patescibacteria group bacterium]
MIILAFTFETCSIATGRDVTHTRRLTVPTEPNTIHAVFADQICSDCYVPRPHWRHSGALVPEGSPLGHFCDDCWEVRKKGAKLPLGTTVYTDRAQGKYVLLRFPDKLPPPSGIEVPDIAALGERVRRHLGVRVNNASVMRAVQFFWDPKLDQELVNRFLNELHGEIRILLFAARNVPYVAPES